MRLLLSRNVSRYATVLCEEVGHLALALAAEVEQILQGAEVDAAPLGAADVGAQHRVRLAGPRLAVREDAHVVPCGAYELQRVLNEVQPTPMSVLAPSLPCAYRASETE